MFCIDEGKSIVPQCFLFYFKRIVNPKMKILSSFTHPQVVPNLYEFFYFLLNTKEDILKKVCNQAVLGHH